MKANEMLKSSFLKPKRIVTVLIALTIVIAAICILPMLHSDEKKVDTTYLVSLLSESSELTTAKLKYTGMSEFEDAGIAFINKANFTMVYEATARIGIDVKEVKVRADDINKVIHVTVPNASVQEVHVDTSTIKYFDEKFALFNLDQKEDSNDAIALVEKEALDEIGNMGVVEMANTQAASLIKGILANAVPDGYTIEVDGK